MIFISVGHQIRLGRGIGSRKRLEFNIIERIRRKEVWLLPWRLPMLLLLGRLKRVCVNLPHTVISHPIQRYQTHTVVRDALDMRMHARSHFVLQC